VPDDRLFHRRLGHSQKVNLLTAEEEIVWRTYVQAADDFGVMRFSPLPLQEIHDRLAKIPAKVVQKMLARVAEVGLVSTFVHQDRTYCFQRDWQDFQKVRYAMATVHPRIPGPLLRSCTVPTQWLHTLWPGGGGRDKKLANWHPKRGWVPPEWTSGSGNGSGNGSRTVPGTVPGTVPERFQNGSRTVPDRHARDRQTDPIPIPDSTELELVPSGQVQSSEDLPALSRRAVEILSKTSEPEVTGAPAAQHTRGLAAALCDRQGADPDRPDDHRQRVEGEGQRPPGRIGFRPPAGGSDQRGALGGGTEPLEAGDTAAAPSATEPVAASSIEASAPDDARGSADSMGGGWAAVQATMQRIARERRGIPSRRRGQHPGCADAVDASSENGEGLVTSEAQQ
jgi:hypothetical protein